MVGGRGVSFPRRIADAAISPQRRCDSGRDHPRGRIQHRPRPAAGPRQGQPHCQRAVRACAGRPLDPADDLHGSDSGEAQGLERTRTPVHGAGDRTAVRRLARSRLRARAAQRHAAGQYRGQRILLPRRALAFGAAGAAELHLRELHPCLPLSHRARRECHRPACREADRRRRAALQPQLQHRHDARHARGAGGRPREVHPGRAGEFPPAVHAGRRRSPGIGIRPHPRRSFGRPFAVRTAQGTGRVDRVRHRHSCRAAGARRRHAADRHRRGGRRRRPRAHPAPSRERRVRAKPSRA